MQKKEQALCMTLYLKHNELVSADIQKNYFDVTSTITQAQGTSQENRTFQNRWQTCQSDQYKLTNTYTVLIGNPPTPKSDTASTGGTISLSHAV